MFDGNERAEECINCGRAAINDGAFMQTKRCLKCRRILKKAGLKPGQVF